MDDMELWNTLYSETVRRNRITAHGPEYFAPLFGNEGSNASVSLLIAEAGKKPLAAMFLSVSSDQATYLYGASSDCQRNSMAPYALQWNAIRKAKEAHCTSYDMFGVSPTADPAHPMYGLYRFKRGFGGRMLHRQGAWDYPYDQHAYTQFLGAEFSAAGFNV
jgi:lipid II:glycine glycyltransferase (peptidoglycan interpeptide bridge formation enzyme)